MTKLFSLCCTPIQNVCHRRKSSSFGIHWPLIWSIINSISHRVQKKRPYKQFCLEINLLITYEQQHLSTAKQHVNSTKATQSYKIRRWISKPFEVKFHSKSFHTSAVAWCRDMFTLRSVGCDEHENRFESTKLICKILVFKPAKRGK